MRALTRLCCLSLLAAASGVAGAATLYQWKDAQGVTHYSESPPPGGKYQARRVDGHGGAPAEATEAAAPAENANCLSARKNLDILGKPGKVMTDRDGDGKPDAELDEAQREAQKGLAEAAIKAYCAPPPAAE
ncbi:DUF4124 domain-containing protein [Xanthomonas sp. NCPPB 2654]|uniref:DUF4124 domain-containing protein n=1 Tax=unclassified Xanthomonas TaxID=2643310 RepID=UPI0021DFC322|nr:MULTISPECIES: DUF4124 domain-containing protein [unclassified Xanthomonas]MDL5366185.1 DUF4124 domain-containing protein [Xanthomonas sp. NCPPB 2654]MDR6673370.1 hypothetical protein [Xanthomonas translucens]MEB1530100.1 DUF4124 domain-containing protein [Xanthomonas campestris pv. campestris]UYC21503.1 DUF4124 domain-containing protein [Xanthomonas sp. CFBP 8443]